MIIGDGRLSIFFLWRQTAVIREVLVITREVFASLVSMLKYLRDALVKIR